LDRRIQPPARRVAGGHVIDDGATDEFGAATYV
jgi:hypothetical protein